jgi:hypothetical protein
MCCTDIDGGTFNEELSSLSMMILLLEFVGTGVPARGPYKLSSSGKEMREKIQYVKETAFVGREQ